MITYEPLNRFAFYFPDKPGFLRNLFIILLIHNLFWSHFSYKINKNFSFFLFLFSSLFPFLFSLLNSLHRKKQTNLELLEYSRIFSNILEYSRISASLQHLINLNFQTGRFICLLYSCIFFPPSILNYNLFCPKKGPRVLFFLSKDVR